jgi:hypothetical protein
MMSIQDLGSLGEFFSAIAVFVTLVYLAVQTRQTRKAAELSAYFSQLQANVSTVDMYSRWRSYLQDPGLLEIIELANSNLDLNDGQQIRLSAAFHELFAAAAGAHLNSVRPDSLYNAKADIEYLANVFDTIPCAAREWHQFKPMAAKVSKELVEAMDTYLERQGNKI